MFALKHLFPTIAAAVMLPLAANAATLSEVRGIASSNLVGNQVQAHHAANGDGLSGDNHNNSVDTVLWLSNGTTVSQQWIAFDFGAIYSLNQVEVWNMNQSGFAAARSITNADIQVSNNGFTWTNVLAGQAFNTADGSASLAKTDTFNLGGAQGRYVRFKVNTNGGDSYVGLSEARFDGTFVANNTLTLGAQLTVSGATVSSTAAGSAAATIDGSGLSAGVHDQAHNSNFDHMWIANGVAGQHITFDLGSSVPVGYLMLWNNNQFDRAFRGIRNADILVSSNGIDFTTLIDDQDFLPAMGIDGYDIPQYINLNTTTQFVRLLINTSWGDGFAGVSEAQFFEIIPEPASATLLGLGSLVLALRSRRR